MLNSIIKKLKESFVPKAIPGLDGIRAISCFFVIAGHFSYLYAPTLISSFGEVMGNAITYSFGNQYTGVTFFFVLSGFLITNILINEFKETGKTNLKSFFIKRIFRIFPAYYFYLICILIWIGQYKLVKFSNQDLLAALTYTYNYLSDLNPWHLAHFWSLSVEEQFYLIWPVLFLIFYKRFGVKMPWLIILISPVLRLVSYYAFPELRPRMSILTHTRFDCLMFGCLLAYYYHMNLFETFNKYILKFKLHLLCLFQILFLSRFIQVIFKGKYTMTVGYSLDSLAMCIIMIYVIQNRNKITDLLNFPILVHLGNLSYSLYLWHIPFAWSELGTNNLILRFCAVYFCALSSYLLIETPFMNLRKRISL